MVEMKRGVGDQRKERINKERRDREMEYEYILFDSIGYLLMAVVS